MKERKKVSTQSKREREREKGPMMMIYSILKIQEEEFIGQLTSWMYVCIYVCMDVWMMRWDVEIEIEIGNFERGGAADVGGRSQKGTCAWE